MQGTTSKERLWARLLANPDALTDLRIIYAEYVNVQAQLVYANAHPRRGPAPMQHEFETFEERQAYLEMVRIASRSRARRAALKETCDSLESQLKMMADDLPLEILDDLLRELQRG